jgi:UDP-N-acetylglucosamine 1-carboxyvinyltransferase
MPGGCAIGDRPVDLHLRGMEALGAEIELDGGDIIARAPGGRLRGGTIFLGGRSGRRCSGPRTSCPPRRSRRGRRSSSAPRASPRSSDLAKLLTAMGARIEGAGSPRLTIHGVESLGGADHAVLPDRIEAATYMCAAAITNGVLTLEDCPLDCLLAVRRPARGGRRARRDGRRLPRPAAVPLPGDGRPDAASRSRSRRSPTRASRRTCRRS